MPATRLAMAAMLTMLPLSVHAEPAAPTAAQTQDATPLNRMRILGSHNSYRPDLTQADLAALRGWLGERAAGVEYGHPPIARQLDLGLRQLEFDPYADKNGGLFAGPYTADRRAHEVMMRPGAKVLHAPVVDARTLCLTLEDCFREVAAWSRANPGHGLIVIFVNVKDEGFSDPRMPKIEPFDEAALAGIDATARSVFGADRLVTPDQVRGRHANLREAVTRGAWPLLGEVHDKFLLVLDSSPAIAATYRRGHPSLAGRTMFAFYDADQPEAAIFNIQDPVKNEAQIKAYVQQGFLVRTRSDADTREARNGDYSRFAAALRSGAQIISTDYYKGAPDPLNLRFVVEMPKP